MKKYLLLLLLLIPISIKAMPIDFKNSVTEEINAEGSYVTVANNIDINSNVKGINMLVGNTIKSKGESEYLISIGNNVEINDIIKNDGFIFGNVVNINSTIERDLLILASDVTISGNINKNATIYAMQVTINGKIENLDIKAQTIIIDGAEINNLSYNEDASIEITNSQITNTNKTDKIYQELTIQEKIINYIYEIGGFLVIFLAFYFIVPKLFERIEKNNENISILNVFSLFGFGALSLILLPIILIITFSLVFCLPLTILLLVLYIIAICLSGLFTGYLLGYILRTKLMKKQNNILLNGLIGITLIKVLELIPVLGTLLMVLSVMIGMGVILQQFKKIK